MSRPEALAFAGFAIALPLLAAALAIGRRAGLLDHPSAIKPHPRPVPYTGGAAIAAALVGVGLVAGLPAGPVAGLALMWLVGLIDDVRGLPATVKLVAEIPPLVVAVAGFGLGLPATVAWVAVGLVLVNAFNVVDGLDGLAGGVALPGLIVLTAAPGWGGALAAIAAGAVAAFLLFNLRPARLFLGDEGSLVIGLVLWLVPLVSLGAGPAGPRWLLWFLLWLFPVANAAFVVAARARAGRSLLRGDRAHLYDVLHRRLGLARALVICWGVAAVGAIAAVATG